MKHKYRFWNPETKQMIYDIELGVKGIEEKIKICSYPGHISMQFIGLKDKNGKEIYEDDILTEGILVTFRNGCFITTYSNDCQNGTPLSKKRCLYLTIIGNIHQNKELLK